jgi:hypothetical protein
MGFIVTFPINVWVKRTSNSKCILDLNFWPSTFISFPFKIGSYKPREKEQRMLRNCPWGGRKGRHPDSHPEEMGPDIETAAFA